MLARKATGRVDGFVIEGPTAGGHNAPPRGDAPLERRGEPVYGERDAVDLAKMRELGVPFWLAGGAGHPERLRAALDAGAAGVQVGGLFAYCDESGIEPELRRSVVEHARRAVRSTCSPTRTPRPPAIRSRWCAGRGDPSQGLERERICDLGYLRVPYRTASGGIGYRCPSEPVATYVAKGGDAADTVGRQCLCNALMATIGHAQPRAGGRREPPLVTGGDDLKHLGDFLNGRTRYSAGDVVDWMLGAQG